jgi:diguanylate cyclase
MTMKGRNPAATGAAIPDNGPMRAFAQIGALLFDHGLPPRPDVYDLLWRYVRDENHLLSLAVDRAIAAGRLDLGTVGELRRTHCSDISAEDVSALIKAANDQAEALSHHLEGGRTDLADYGRAIADGGARLAAPLDATGLALLLEQFGATERAAIIDPPDGRAQPARQTVPASAG